MKKYLLVVLSMTLILSEIMLRLKPEWGFILYSVLIGGCLISLTELDKLDNKGKLIVLFMILPIVRISELFIEFDFLIRTFIIYYILGFLVVYYSLKFKINPGYTKKGLVLIPLVAIVGVMLGIMGNSLFEFTKYPELVFLLPVIAFSEELLFRGLIQNIMSKDYGLFVSLFFSSLLYCVFSGFPVLILIFAMSLINGVIYHYTKNIYLPMVINVIFHLFVLIL